MSDSVEADADVAARYLKALTSRGVAHTDAVSMTNAYMGMRAAIAGQSATQTSLKLKGLSS